MNVLENCTCSVLPLKRIRAGKTFTMLGTKACPGIVYLTVTSLWEKMEALKEIQNYDIGVSYFEIYNESVQDLLGPGKSLNILEDPKVGVKIEGLSERKPKNAEELLEILRIGNKKRTQHPTDESKESSRSHAVFQVLLSQCVPTKKSNYCLTKLLLIDLTGSESGTATGHSGARFQEGRSIAESMRANEEIKLLPYQTNAH
ncbi:hypothetical protein QYM36_018130 [Artemia franciscana]|uniref:Kinesin motor domain-containing protein n=1 Tax=Artemia franciscana TaxID=6661 RepID=A0AA88HAF1_ARTSF|nr:hypothetical protein QYM36_018130 [Artemia franciscana]